MAGCEEAGAGPRAIRPTSLSGGVNHFIPMDSNNSNSKSKMELGEQLGGNYEPFLELLYCLVAYMFK